MNVGQPEIRIFGIAEVDPQFVKEWRELFRHSLSANVYLSPEFVLEALNTFYTAWPRLFCLKRNGLLMALAVVEDKPRSRSFPLKSRKLFKTQHSFQSGLLVRQSIDDRDLDIFVNTLIDGVSALYFQEFDASTDLAEKLRQSAARIGAQWYERLTYSRAALRSDISMEAWSKSVSKKKRKEVNRNRRRLEDKGVVEWRMVPSKSLGSENIDTFLELEHDSWKGDQGESLLAREEEALFFRRSVAALKEQGEVFFTELVLDGVVIASTVNFLAGSLASAFKVAWKREFSRYSPGIINEVAFIECVVSQDMPFEVIESGATTKSYIDAYWPEEIPMFTGYLVRGNYFVRMVVWLLGMMRSFKRHLSHLIGVGSR